MATKEANRFVSKELSKLYAQHREGHSKEFYKFIVDVLTKKVKSIVYNYCFISYYKTIVQNQNYSLT